MYLWCSVRVCSIEKPTQFTWKLRIKSIQLPEQGNYTCFVYTTRQNRKEANMTVVVMGMVFFKLKHVYIKSIVF